MNLEKLSEIKCFDGLQQRYQHLSKVNQCLMTFSIFLPPQAKKQKVPVLYWLSGLTCTDENFVTKAGAQQYATKYGVAIVCPDTSPRGECVPDDDNAAYDFGVGAGFYVNATKQPWKQHYQMYDYVVLELPKLIKENFQVDTDNASIFGHSMGGHGALTIALKNQNLFHSVSAFAPICSPMQCPWGEKSLENYLGGNKEDWRQYDTIELLKSTHSNKLPILVDQGTADNFLDQQLKPELLEKAATEYNFPLIMRYQEGYDHSYFFISSFIEEHIAFHVKHLKTS